MKALISCLVLVVAHICSVAATSGTSSRRSNHVRANATIRTETPLTRVSNSFLGVNIDAASLYQGTRLDFDNAQLKELVRVLGEASPHPMVLRVGGSAADDLTFREANVTIHVSYTYWDDLLDFCNRSGLSLSFDLNALSLRNRAGEWDSGEAQDLLAHVRDKGQTVWAFQLGNEPGHWQTRHGGVPGPAAHGADFVALRKLLGTQHRIQGPDVCFGAGTEDSPCASLEYLSTLLKTARGSIDDITVHNYGLTGPRAGKGDQCQLASFLTPSLWTEHLRPTFEAWKKIQEAQSPGSKLVLSETATAADGGCPGLSNSFAAGFYFIDVLGMAGEMGFNQVYRQDLVGFSGVNGGSSYALAGDPGWYNASASGPLRANPDFFTATIWRKLMGSTRLATDISSSSIRLYAACDNRLQNGSVALAFANPIKDSVALDIGGAGDRKVFLYSFSAPEGNLTSRSVLVNGVLMESPSQGLSVAPKEVRANKLVLEPFTFGFVIDINARAEACSKASLSKRDTGTDAECADPRDYGAKIGNPGPEPGYWKSNQRAIQAAISANDCVEVSGGDFATGDLFLKSSSIFRVAEGARLLSSINNTATALIHIENVSNVILEGAGVLYGNAEHAYSFYSEVDNRFQPAIEDGKRPHLVIVHDSDNVTIKNLHLHNSTDWNIWVRHSSNVLIDAVEIFGDSRFPNNDGIEPDSCVNLTISNSRIDVADDGISPISSAQDGPLRNLHVFNTTIRSKSHAIKFGSVCQASCSDSVFENITIFDSNSGLSIQQRGAGNVSNITFRHINVQTRYQAPRWWGNGEWLSITAEPRFNSTESVGEISGLRFEHIRAMSENGALISGAATTGIYNISFLDVHVTVASGLGNYSSGNGPPCCVPGGRSNISCMGTHDHRPSYREDFNCTLFGNCRTPAKANMLYLENTHGVKLERFKGTFAKPRKHWFAEKCVDWDQATTGVDIIGELGCNL